MKKVLIAAIVLIVGIAVFGGWLFTAKDTTLVYEHDDYAVSLQVPSALNFEFVGEQEVTVENTTDVIQAFDITLFGMHAGSYSIVERTLGNGTVFLFERLNNESWLGYGAETAFTFTEDAALTTKSWNPEKIEHEYHGVFGVDPTVNPFGHVTASTPDETHELVVGNVYVSKELVKEYEHHKMSRLRELDQEHLDIKVEDATVTKNFKVGRNKIAESWMLLAGEPLFSSESEEDDYIDFALNNQESQLNWLTVNGPYTKLPFSIDPSTEMGYGRAIGRIEDDVALSWYNQSNSVFFESMVLNSRVNLLTYLDEFEGTRWPTEYTSTWLSNAYGVRAPYVDTRYNEYVAFFLDQTAREFKDDVQNAALYVPVYADYLLSRVEEDEIIVAGDGYLIVDYFDEDPTTPVTHASLNHELGGLKILLTAFDETGDAKYMDVATAVITGIESFGSTEGGWIRDNGDLWYQARPDGTFSGDDYPQLTLLDLLETQQLLEAMELPRNTYFDEMIDAKLAYLASEDIELIEKVTRLME